MSSSAQLLADLAKRSAAYPLATVAQSRRPDIGCRVYVGLCETGGAASRDNWRVSWGRNATFRLATGPSSNCQNPHRLF